MKPTSFILLVSALGAAAAPSDITVSSVTQRPWIVNDNGTLKSETELAISNGTNAPAAAWVRISVPGRADCIENAGQLAPGANKITVKVPELTKDGDTVTFSVFTNATATGEPISSRALPQKRIRHWRLHILHNSHQDIGYTDYQEHLKTAKWPSFWDQALLKDMPRSDAWQDDAKIRLEAEGTYQLDTSIAVRDADWFETLRQRLREGRFAYSSTFGDIAHNNWGAEELARSTYHAARYLKDRTGVDPSGTIVMRDEPTLSWGVIDAITEAGAKYFVLQHNYDHNLWRGTTSYPEYFFARGKNPANKLLVWNSLFGGYGEDELRLRNNNIDDTMNRISNKLMGYQSAGNTEQGGQYGPARIADGVTGKQDTGEWASAGEQKPWIQLTWPAPKSIGKIRILDRNNHQDNVNGGTLSFSDGTSVEVTGVPADGTAKEVTFPERNVTWIRFHATGGTGQNVGLSEMEVFAGAANIAGEAKLKASSTYGGGSSFEYPYDVACVNFTLGGDNNPMVPQVYESVKALNGKGYAFPRVICSNYKEFFGDMEKNWSAKIPSYQGTVEDWWNFGAASTAYETGINRRNHDKLAAAEFLATVSAAAVPGQRYPYETLYTAWENLQLYDEHTWGSPQPAVDEQWRWKRNTALASDTASSKVLADSMAAINTLIPTTGPTLVIHNNLSWNRTDIATVPTAGLPEHFDLTDSTTGKAVPYQTTDAGIAFVAAEVPGHGYKTYRITERKDAPKFPSGTVTATPNTLENRFFKVTFDAAGNVTGILDKQHGNTELVDAASPHPLNQYLVFKEGQLIDQSTKAKLTCQAGPVMGSVSADGPVTGLDALRRTVVLYDDLPRIDIINRTIKGQQIANVEMGYFSFPLNVENFMLRHEMPTGDMRPGVNSDVDDPANEQYYSSATAFYTVNRWIDASNRKDRGITFASLDAPLVSYGKPDIGATKGGWSVAYNTEKPWIYSMAYNNEWQTNFQKTQPGRADFQYSIRSHAGGTWQDGKAEFFGAETSSPLRVSVIAAKQTGRGFDPAKDSFIGIDRPNVVLTAAKLAEANGEGIIIRFNEISGKATTVTADIGWFSPESVTATSLIEDNLDPVKLSDGKITFTIQPFGFRTFRLTRGTAPQPVAELSAKAGATGCLVTWQAQPEAACYEIFRGTDANFTPGTGTYIGTVSVPRFFDPAVKPGLTKEYHYAVRAVQAGRKGSFQARIKASPNLTADTVPPTSPALSGRALHSSKVTLSWLPAADNHAVKGYKVFRDGKPIADLAGFFNSWMDADVKPNTEYHYEVKAIDLAGNPSATGASVTVTTLP